MNKLFKSFLVWNATPHALDIAFAVEKHERGDRPDTVTAPKFLGRIAVQRVRGTVLAFLERVKRSQVFVGNTDNL